MIADDQRVFEALTAIALENIEPACFYFDPEACSSFSATEFVFDDHDGIRQRL